MVWISEHGDGCTHAIARYSRSGTARLVKGLNGISRQNEVENPPKDHSAERSAELCVNARSYFKVPVNYSPPQITCTRYCQDNLYLTMAGL